MDETPTVVLVEDEALILEMMKREFEEEGFTVRAFARAEDALDLLGSTKRVDVLFTDIRLAGGGMDGWKLAEMTRHVRPELPILFATGYSEKDPVGVDPSCFFLKPYSVDAVVRAVKRAVGPSRNLST